MRIAKSTRQRQILQELDRAPSLRVADLARRLGVSTETIRRDLDEMTDRGELNRTYGGAIRSAAEEPSLSQRHSLHVAERQRIAQAALPLIRSARVLMIGSGATTVHLAREIAAHMADLTVITHAVGVANTLATNAAIRVLMVPGSYHAGEGATFGAEAAEFLGRYHADAVLTGASGLGPDGPSDALIDIGAVYAAMGRQAGRRIVLADHSKFDQVFPAIYAPWAAIDALVTDQPPPRALADRLARAAVLVVQAPPGAAPGSA